MKIHSPLGQIVFLGEDDGEFKESAALVVDLGGNDIYSEKLGSGSEVPGRVAVAVDMEGHDKYGRSDLSRSAGFGCLSIGMLIDMAGNDKYLCGDMGQGSGMFGIGILRDWDGNDTYQMGLMGQGFAVFGTGLLVDNSGDDQYIVRGMGQGCASTMGIAVLCDTKGNDKYLADINRNKTTLIADEWCHAQGAGMSIRAPDWKKFPSFYGGVGFLSDGSGNDAYYASHGNVMGSSYFMSAGALVDHKGNDQYFPKNGYGAASAVHLSNAVLIDRNGNDFYFAKTQTGGVGSDRSTAVLADYRGNDIYGPTFEMAKNFAEKEKKFEKGDGPKQTTISIAMKNMADVSYGSAKKPKAFGFMIDYQGNDMYFARDRGDGESLGGIVPPVDPEDWSHGILMDLGGQDSYSKGRRKDNHYYTYYNHGICYDTEYIAGKDIFTKVSSTDQDLKKLPEELLEGVQKSLAQNELTILLEDDLYRRFNAMGKIIEKGPEIISELTSILSTSENNNLNRDLIEIFTTFVTNREIKNKHTKYFVLLLGAKDPFVREYAAGTLGWWHVESSEPAVIDMLADPKEEVRSAAISALGEIGSTKAVISLMEVFKKDDSQKCRRGSIKALTLLLKNLDDTDTKLIGEIETVFLNAIDNADPVIKKNAADGIRYLPNKDIMVNALKKCLKNKDVYVRRAAAKSLILGGNKEELPILIESLQFPSIDTFNHYDHEIATDLSFYCGVDFEEPGRYEYATWQKWWEDNASALDLEQNLKIMRNITMAFAVENEDKGIEIFEKLMREYPGNKTINKRYQRFCYEWITFRLLTLEEMSEPVLKRIKKLKTIKAGLESRN